MEILKLPFIIFLIIKRLLIHSDFFGMKGTIVTAAAIILTLNIAPFVFMSLPIFYVYHFVVDAILKRVFRENYKGIANGVEAIYCCNHNCAPIGIFFVEFDKSLAELRHEVWKQLNKIAKSKYNRLFYFRDHFLGLNYFYKRDFYIDDVIVMMEKGAEEILTKRQFSEKLTAYDKLPLPIDDKMMFQVVICSQPVFLDDFPDKKNIYAVSYKVHHSVCDGNSFLNLFTSSFINGSVLPKKKLVAPKTNNWSRRNFEITTLPMLTNDDNVLRGCNLNQEKIMVCFSDPTNEYFDKIKKIKKHFKGTTVLDIINTCLCSSLYDVYKKSGSPIPKTITGAFAMLPQNAKVAPFGSDDFHMGNHASALCFKMPIDVSGGNKLVKRLVLLQKNYESVRNSYDLEFNTWISNNLMYFVPSPLIKFAAKQFDATAIVTSIPGFEEVSMYGGAKVRDFHVLCINSFGTAIHMLVTTYMGKLKIDLKVDTSVMKSYEEVQAVVDSVVYYLDELSAICDKMEIKNGD